MSSTDLKELVGKLNDTSRRAMEAAAGLCLSRTNYNIEIEHWLIKLLEVERSDLRIILSSFEIESSRMLADLNRSIDRFKTGNGRPPSLSPKVVQWIREAWLFASIDRRSYNVRSGDLLVALLSAPELRLFAGEASKLFDQIDVQSLRKDFPAILADSIEHSTRGSGQDNGAANDQRTGPGQRPTQSPSLDQFTIDLTARAASGKIDPVLGRDAEVRQIIDILMRRRQNNPILTGEAGVGKTAVVEGFALRIAAGDVPEAIQDVRIHSLDLGLLQAGAGMKGEFENRLKGVIDEVKASATPIVLFIDEAHTMIGAGGSAGQGDAANLLKPALARGELRTIAATTWAEYKKYFEKDAALARRFQVVKIEEPEESVAIEMMRGLVGTLQSHHKVQILNEAVVDAVKLSKRYISGRQLPDKAVSLLDTTCARIALSQSSTPPAIEDLQRRLDAFRTSQSILTREQAIGVDHSQRLQEISESIAESEAELALLESQWEREKNLTTDIQALRENLESDSQNETEPPTESDGDQRTDAAAEPMSSPSSAPLGSTNSNVATVAIPQVSRETQISRLHAFESELRSVQGERPLMYACVDAGAVAETVASWTGIPVGRMVSNEIQTVLNLKNLMERSIVGQSHALEEIAQSIRTSRAGLRDPRTPIGVFLLAGTSGVGKTETAITLANLLYGGEQNMTTINMSEFKEEHKVSLLMGSPPGYVGYGEGGVLTEAVRRKPYSVILLDEMEKAHPGVQDVFYQVFDKGQMKDGEGRDIDFKNTVVIMTTNAGTDLIKDLCASQSELPAPEEFSKAVFPELLRTFKPAFLGRVSVIPYYPLSDDVMERIVRLKLGKVKSRVFESYKADFNFGEDVVELIRSRCTEVDTGARNVDHILNRTVLPELSSEVLACMADGGTISAISINVEDGRFSYEVRA